MFSYLIIFLANLDGTCGKQHVKNISKITSQLLAMEVGTRQTHGGFDHAGRPLRSGLRQRLRWGLITEAAETTSGT